MLIAEVRFIIKSADANGSFDVRSHLLGFFKRTGIVINVSEELNWNLIDLLNRYGRGKSLASEPLCRFDVFLELLHIWL